MIKKAVHSEENAAKPHIVYGISHVMNKTSKGEYDMRITIYGFMCYALCALRFC